jgi:type I protein arginine methyltransferase
MYSIYAFGTFIANRVRMDAYRQALRWAIQSESVVLDIGTGTGIFALLALKMGARRVYAIEPDGVIQVARDLAAANGFASRIEFFQALSTQINLPERADVIISDIRGSLPFHKQGLAAIIDARRRFLAPGGILIPRCDTLWAAVVADPRLYRRYLGIWDGKKFKLDFTAVRNMAVNNVQRFHVGPEKLLASPQCWGRLDYSTLANPNLKGEITWEIDRPGTAHGLVIWFDTELAPGLGFSNAPGAPKLIYAQTFFPWPRPVNLRQGDRVAVSLAAHLAGEDYLWNWNTRIQEPGPAERLKAEFRQSSFLGLPLSPAIFEHMGQNHLPELNEAGLIDRFILEQMDGQSSLAEIARQLVAKFPSRFIGAPEALGRVQELSGKYSR